MKIEINTLKRLCGALLMLCAIVAGTVLTVEAQGRRYGQRRVGSPPYGRAYGYYARRERRALRRHQRFERRTLREQWRNERNGYSNDSSFRDRWQQNRRELRLHQRQEREAFRQRLRSNRRRS